MTDSPTSADAELERALDECVRTVIAEQRMMFTRPNDRDAIGHASRKATAAYYAVTALFASRTLTPEEARWILKDFGAVDLVGDDDIERAARAKLRRISEGKVTPSSTTESGEMSTMSQASDRIRKAGN